MFKIKILIFILAVGVVALFVRQHHEVSVKDTAQKVTAQATAAKAAIELASHCQNNKLDKTVIVSISKRHMWACELSKTVYDNPVITGMEMYPADLTPPGTYKVYAKTTDVHLAGSDSTGSWDDAVQYWMPFLDNQYGTYGFHDATWRTDKEFGSVDPNSKEASHGCVELPLAAMKWLYNWAPTNTVVNVVS